MILSLYQWKKTWMKPKVPETVKELGWEFLIPFFFFFLKNWNFLIGNFGYWTPEALWR